MEEFKITREDIKESLKRIKECSHTISVNRGVAKFAKFGKFEVKKIPHWTSK